MTPHLASTRDEWLEHVVSDEPAPDIDAAVVVSHAGDECLGASRAHDPATDAITWTGLPADRCHNLGWVTGSLEKHLETLTWLISAAVKTREPRLLVSHANEGVSLDHDAVAFAVQMTSLLLPSYRRFAVSFRSRAQDSVDVHSPTC